MKYVLKKLIYVLKAVSTMALIIVYWPCMILSLTSILLVAADDIVSLDIMPWMICLMVYIGFLINWIGIVKVRFHYVIPMPILLVAVLLRGILRYGF